MAYRPERPMRFGPSFQACLPSYGYLAVATLFAAFVAYGYLAPPSSVAHRYVVEAARDRPVPASWFAWVVIASGLAAVLRTHMRGVVVRADGLESLDLHTIGLPTMRRLHWPMIDAFRFDVSTRYVGIDLWNGTREFLPEVGDREKLVRALVFIARARAIPYSGGPTDFDGELEAEAD